MLRELFKTSDQDNTLYFLSFLGCPCLIIYIYIYSYCYLLIPQRNTPLTANLSFNFQKTEMKNYPTIKGLRYVIIPYKSMATQIPDDARWHRPHILVSHFPHRGQNQRHIPFISGILNQLPQDISYDHVIIPYKSMATHIIDDAWWHIGQPFSPSWIESTPHPIHYWYFKSVTIGHLLMTKTRKFRHYKSSKQGGKRHYKSLKLAKKAIKNLYYVYFFNTKISQSSIY